MLISSTLENEPKGKEKQLCRLGPRRGALYELRLWRGSVPRNSAKGLSQLFSFLFCPPPRDTADLIRCSCVPMGRPSAGSTLPYMRTSPPMGAQDVNRLKPPDFVIRTPNFLGQVFGTSNETFTHTVSSWKAKGTPNLVL